MSGMIRSISLAFLLVLIAVHSSLGLTADDREFIDSPDGREVAAGLKAYFDAPPIGRHNVALKDSWDALLLEHPTAVRHLAWDAYCHGDALRKMTEDHEANRVTFQEYATDAAASAQRI